MGFTVVREPIKQGIDGWLQAQHTGSNLCCGTWTPERRAACKRRWDAHAFLLREANRARDARWLPNEHWAPQTLFLNQRDANDNPVRIDLVARLEHLKEDWKKVVAKVPGVPTVLPWTRKFKDNCKEQILSVMSDDDLLVLCTIRWQDYRDLNYPLPEACKKHKSWLQAHGW